MIASRHLKSIGGNASVSVASLASAAAVFYTYSASEFGFYSLALIFSTLLFSVVNSLFVAAMQDYITKNDLSEIQLSVFVAINLCGLFVLAIIFGIYTQLIYSNPHLTLSVVAFLWLSGFRWLAKCYRQMLSDVNSYVISDAILSFGMFICSFALFLFNLNLAVFFWLMALTQILSLFSLKVISLLGVIPFYDSDSITKFKLGFQKRGKDALIGTFYVELTQNSHSYLISIFAGTHVFAPIALANLMYRPFAVVMVGLVQAERPRISVMLSDRKKEQAIDVCLKLKNIVLAALFVNSILIFCFVYIFDDYVLSKVGDLNAFVTFLIFVFVICVVRAYRFIYTLFFQSSGDYTVLKDSCLYGGLLCVSLVLFFLNFGFLQTSISAVFFGELLMLFYLRSKIKKC